MKSNTQRYLGPFLFNQTYGPTRLDQIHDGLSNTIFVGEARPYCTWTTYAYGWASSNNGCGQLSTEIPMNYDTCTGSYVATPRPGNSDGCGYANSGMSYGFKSRHPGGVQFLMGDGAVLFFKETLDHVTFQYLGASTTGMR